MSKHGEKKISFQELVFCKEYALTDNARRSARIAFEGKYKMGYINGPLTHKLLARTEILDKIKKYREDFFTANEKIGEEILTRARAADDNKCHQLYQIAVNIMGLEAPKKSERKDEKIFSIPQHESKQIEDGKNNQVVDAEEVKEIEGDDV